MTVHLTFKNFLPVIVGVCVVVLAIIPLVVSPEHLSWHRWQAAIIAATVIAVVALLVQAALQSREDKEREKREQQRDQREQERDGILTDMRNKLSDISQKPVEQQLNIISTLRTRVNDAIASQVSNDLPEPRPKSFDWHREWIEMERDFNRVDDRRIYAECRPDNRTGWDTWHILSDLDEAPEIQKTADTQKCKALCDLAGSRLMASVPMIPVSEDVRSQTENWIRWLCYLRETETDDFTVQNYSRAIKGKTIMHQGGRIKHLTRISVNACIKCRATTYPKQQIS